MFLYASLYSILIIYLLRRLINFYVFCKKVNKFVGNPVVSLFGDVWNLSRETEKLFYQIREFGKKFRNGYRLWSMHYAIFNIIRAEDAEVIMSNPKYNFKESIYITLYAWLGKGLLTSDGPKWHQRRKILTPAFHFNVLRKFVVIFGEHCDKFVNDLRKECVQERVNVVPICSKLTLDLICETAMGVRLEENNTKQNDYRKAIYRIGELVVERTVKFWYFTDYPYFLLPKGREYLRCAKISHDFTNDIIRERERNFQDSDVDNLDVEEENYATFTKKRFAMLDLLISAKRNSGQIDDAGIREEVETFIFEGHDTTAMAISFTVFCLANYKDVQEKAREEVDHIFKESNRPANYQDLQNMYYLDLVIKETLRLYPSVPLVSRELIEEARIHDGKGVLPAGLFAHIHIYDIHHDERYFKDPEKFDPERFLPENSKNRHPYAYVPFSAGPRNCIGQKFAILEVKSVISSLLRNFEILPVDTLKTLKFKADLVLRPANGLYVQFKPRVF